MIDVDVVVIGGGPTGIAALIEAKRAGLSAFAVEAGTVPVSSLVGYLQGLVLLSHASHFEVGLLPLDCRDPSAVTREEVLSYFHRVVAHEELDIRCGHRCTALEAEEGGVLVRTRTSHGEHAVRARDVIVTCWYGPRRLPAELEDPEGRVSVLRRIADVASVPGRHVVVLGAGVSAFEHASAALLLGKRVTVVSRGPAARGFRQAPFERLAGAGRCEIFTHAEGICVVDGGVAFRHRGARLHRACESAIACLGHEVLPDIKAILESLGALDAPALEKLDTARGPDGWKRLRPTILDEQLHPLLVGERPDLHALLYLGHRGVRVAGGALHVGGPDAGVATSIATARIAVRAIVGSAEPELERPLPAALLAWAAESAPPSPSYDAMEAIRPLARGHREELGRERRSGLHEPSRPSSPRPSSPRPSSPRAPASSDRDASSDPDAALLTLCDGARSVAEIVASDPRAPVDVVADLVANMRDGTLTWLPR